ncbi:MAG: glucose-1-phosphate cytidylyltransferase [Pseudomonadota bacterium]
MKVVLLCGGKGTRIRDVSAEIPKPMIPIGGVPIVRHIMDRYAMHGMKEFVLCLGYKGWKIKEYFLNIRAEVSDLRIDLSSLGGVEVLDRWEPLDWSVILAETGLEAMTGARVSRVRKYLGESTFMLTYGDGLGNVDVGALLEFHRSHGHLATITSVRPPARFGELLTEGDRVTSFQEKPQTAAGVINGGFFVLEPGVFDYLSDDDSCIFERDPLQRLAADGELYCYQHDGFWMPMDTHREYTLLNQLWAKGEAPWTTG